MSRASVSEHVKRLVGDGLLEQDGRTLRFTEEGETLAVSLVRRHRLAEHLLIDIIGLPWHKAHEHAERWERVIDDEVEGRLVEILADPGACPHGNPIPGSANEVDVSALVALNDVELGSRGPSSPHRRPRARARSHAVPRGKWLDAGRHHRGSDRRSRRNAYP